MGAPSKPCFLLEQTFFGFKPEHQVQLHDQLYELLIAGEGRWDWDTIYNLPLHLRKFWISKINKQRTADAERAEQQAQKAANASTRRAKS
jgi:hypothetical protein